MHIIVLPAQKGTYRQGLGRSRGGFTTKLHAATNADGLPVGLLITSGETHDAKVATDLLDTVSSRPKVLLGDKGYDSNEICHHARFHGTLPLTPTKSNRKIQFTVDRTHYSLRNRIERYFNKLKSSRRVATRYDKTADSFLGFVQIPSVRILLRFVNTT